MVVSTLGFFIRFLFQTYLSRMLYNSVGKIEREEQKLQQRITSTTKNQDHKSSDLSGTNLERVLLRLVDRTTMIFTLEDSDLLCEFCKSVLFLQGKTDRTIF
jgi:hypothetical protein